MTGFTEQLLRYHDRKYPLMRLFVPLVESRIVRSAMPLCLQRTPSFRTALGIAAWLVQDLLYRDVLRESLGFGRTLAFAAFTKRSD